MQANASSAHASARPAYRRADSIGWLCSTRGGSSAIPNKILRYPRDRYSGPEDIARVSRRRPRSIPKVVTEHPETVWRISPSSVRTIRGKFADYLREVCELAPRTMRAIPGLSPRTMRAISERFANYPRAACEPSRRSTRTIPWKRANYPRAVRELSSCGMRTIPVRYANYPRAGCGPNHEGCGVCGGYRRGIAARLVLYPEDGDCLSRGGGRCFSGIGDWLLKDGRKPSRPLYGRF